MVCIYAMPYMHRHAAQVADLWHSHFSSKRLETPNTQHPQPPACCLRTCWFERQASFCTNRCVNCAAALAFKTPYILSFCVGLRLMKAFLEYIYFSSQTSSGAAGARGARTRADAEPRQRGIIWKVMEQKRKILSAKGNFVRPRLHITHLNIRAGNFSRQLFNENKSLSSFLILSYFGRNLCSLVLRTHQRGWQTSS